MPMGRFRRTHRATQLVREGARSFDRDQLDEALVAYRDAVAIDPRIPEAWFDIGLIHKRRREWPAALDANLRVLDLRSGEGEPAWWNAGIAATALRDWPTARRAWAGYGIAVPPGDGELLMDLGPCPVRLRPDDVGEVVWGTRIDPCRLRIDGSVPLPESGYRWRDVVLHDGVPVGTRRVGDREVGVFDEIERWAASTMTTVEATVVGLTTDDLGELIDLAGERDAICESWSASVRWLCDACSRGRPDPSHVHPSPTPSGPQRLGIAGARHGIEALIDDWASGRPHLTVTAATVLD